MFQRIATVTYRTAHFSKSKSALQNELGYELVHDDLVGETLANAWGATNTAARQSCVLQAASGEPFYLRLIEGEVDDSYAPLTTFGWNAAELLVADVFSTAELLAESRFRILGGPRDLMNNGVAIALQVQGPGDELFYLTQIGGKPMQSTYGAATCPVDRLFIVVLGAKNHDETREFYRPLVSGVTKPRQFAIRVLSAAHELDAATEYEISAACLPNQFRIEIDSYPDSAVGRTTADGDIPPGLSMVSFTVESLDNFPLPCSIHTAPDIAPYFGCRFTHVTGPNDEWIELLELPAYR